ncbi:hypothetical protein PtrSN002B_012006 [Pyrenophora tritici-repentis]|uniref:Uncharacterized protein n=1 Tax=Pyrenophora tritici-repentis TaxID=45151 RepID=A0A317AHH3_9PLEO|nr:hypothetical protein PtrV1_02020 [Pyrenophora tritici-repentis]KAF7454755.1 hypothetical protein A1F99_020130 [Pyrenophora tritici-repentis]KAF7577886.1 hypothetical protein PtrM4_021260 [Pyrenophora tritici-repentis]KAG9388514.1 hypothetical protein A1F94_001406 [Pyrenophora tritici-repentis]KAI0570217.1 hypothetical protein Alg130_11312 [Pyrenophora tritici-repentis]
MEAFNTFFEGKVLKAADGNHTPPRPACTVDSIGGKLKTKTGDIAKERQTI